MLFYCVFFIFRIAFSQIVVVIGAFMIFDNERRKWKHLFFLFDCVFLEIDIEAVSLTSWIFMYVKERRNVIKQISATLSFFFLLSHF